MTTTSLVPNIGWVPPGSNVLGTQCEELGADPSNDASDNTNFIQQALNKGGFVSLLTPGTYLLNCNTPALTSDGNTYNTALYIGNNTTFFCGPGVVLKAGGTDSAVNNPVIIKNSNPSGGNTNISLIGGTYDQGMDFNTFSHINLNSGTGSWASIAIWMQNVTTLAASGLTLQNCSAGFGINQITGGTFKDIFINDTGTPSGTGKGSYLWPFGRNKNLYFGNIYGQCDDDMIGLIANMDFDPRFTNLMGGPGPVSDVIIDGVKSDSVNGSWNFVRIGPSSSTHTMSRIQVKNISGPYVDTAIKFGSYQYSTSGQIDDIIIDGVDVTPLTNSGSATIHSSNNSSATVSSLMISNYRCSIASSVAVKPFFRFNGVGTITNLMLNNCEWIANSTGASALNFVILGGGVTTKAITISNVRAETAVTAGDGAFLTVTASTLENINISNVYIRQIGNVLLGDNACVVSKHISLSNITTFNPQHPSILLNRGGSYPFITMNGFVVDGAGGGTAGFVSVSSQTGTTAIFAQGCIPNQTSFATSTLVRAGGSPIVRWVSPDSAVVTTIISSVLGDIMIDANTSTGVMCTTAPNGYKAL